MPGRHPEGGVIRIVLDNHATHTSQETMRYLAAHPGRFEYVHTPRHASWLNLVEVSFSRMARTFLRTSELNRSTSSSAASYRESTR